MSNVDNFTVQLSYLKIINRLRFRTFFSVFLQSGAFVFKRCLLSLSLRLSKPEEDKDELKATLSSLKKEGCKINRTLKVSQQNVNLLSRLELLDVEQSDAMPNQSCNCGVTEFT